MTMKPMAGVGTVAAPALVTGAVPDCLAFVKVVKTRPWFHALLVRGRVQAILFEPALGVAVEARVEVGDYVLDAQVLPILDVPKVVGTGAA